MKVFCYTFGVTNGVLSYVAHLGKDEHACLCLLLAAAVGMLAGIAFKLEEKP